MQGRVTAEALTEPLQALAASRLPSLAPSQVPVIASALATLNVHSRPLAAAVASAAAPAVPVADSNHLSLLVWFFAKADYVDASLMAVADARLAVLLEEKSMRSMDLARHLWSLAQLGHWPPSDVRFSPDWQ